MAAGKQNDYYSEIAHLYSDPMVRPEYPPDLYEKIYAFAGDTTDAALDVATGSGQCAKVLAERYKQVWAVDQSEGQLEHAASHPRVSYSQASASETGLPSKSVDLVTVATALHWFDIPAFYREARRVLREGGCLATWAYKFPNIESHPAADAVLRRFFDTQLRPHMGRIHHIWLDEFRGNEPTPAEFGRVERAETAFKTKSTIAAVVKFVASAGLMTQMRQENPDMVDPLPRLEADLKAAMHTDDRQAELSLCFPMFMVLSKDPKPL